jgi:exosortase family protein XrtF
MNWREFIPTIVFLSKFLVFYLVGNLLYGLFVTAFNPQPDPVTQLVTRQTSACLSLAGWDTTVKDRIDKPTTTIVFDTKSVVTVYEGCSGLNVMIIFIAFVFAFGPLQKAMFWFVPLGLFIIHVSNLFRIALLFTVTLYRPGYLYFTHKYLFTAFIYGFVLLLWIWWVRNFSEQPNHAG